MGRIQFRVALAILIGFAGLGLQGCRLTWASWGASSEPAVIRLADLTPGGDFENRHLTLEEFVPLLDDSYAQKSDLFIPLAPRPANSGAPLEQFVLDSLGQDARIIASIPASQDYERTSELLFGGQGLVMGSAEKVCSAETRTVLKKRLGLQSVNHFAVIELGRKPSLLLGIAMLLGGLLGFFGSAFVMMKQVSD